MTTAERIDRVVEALRACAPERIYVFGSAARGEADDLSDLDVVVVARSDLPFFDRLRDVGRLLPADVGAVDLLVYTPSELSEMVRRGNAFAEMLLEEGLLVDGAEG